MLNKLTIVGLNTQTWPKKSNKYKIPSILKMLRNTNPDILIILETGENLENKLIIPN